MGRLKLRPPKPLPRREIGDPQKLAASFLDAVENPDTPGKQGLAQAIADMLGNLNDEDEGR